LRRSAATLARSLFGPMPQEQVRRVSSRTARRSASATPSPDQAARNVAVP
jgi:hypothetical protein